MPDSVLGARVNKVLDKSAWTILSKAHEADRQNLQTVHSRDIGRGPDEFEVVKKYTGPAYIEPVHGYVISKNGCLLDESMNSNFKSHEEPWRSGTASFSDFLKARNDESRIIRVPVVISLRHFWEWNFYHFYADVLGKINLYDELGLEKSTPLAIGKYYDDVPFVKQIIHEGALGKREWLIQRNKYVLADEIYFCRSKQGRVKKLDTIAEQMGVPVPEKPEGKRIFLTRPQSGIRHIINNEEVEKLTAKYNYETVDFSRSSVAEQIQVLNGTRHLIAIHGAGMVNMIFRRRAPMTVIAIDSPIYTTVDYPEIAEEFGYHYMTLNGHSPVGSPQHSSFKVDVDALEAKIIEALATE